MTASPPPEPADGQLQPLVAAELARLAGALEPLAPEAWDTPSLCSAWRVREVIAHLTMAARYDPDQFLAELAADGFDFDKLSNRIAARDGSSAPDVLLGDLRSHAMASWAPPGGGYAGALSHVIIHGLDVTVPLGLGRVASDDAIAVVLDALADGGHAHFGTDPAGFQLRSTDLDWAFGSGTVVEAPAHQIVLTLAGRSVPGAPPALLAGHGRGPSASG